MQSFIRSPATSSNLANQNSRFPSLAGEPTPRYSEDAVADGDSTPVERTDDLSHEAQAQTRRNGGVARAMAAAPSGPRRSRQKSLSEALRTIHNRRGSVSESAHEIAEALKAPISPRLIFLCGLWYMTSIFSNASSKAILTAFRYPVTLTLVQFAFVSSLCVFSSWLAQTYPPLKTIVPALKYHIRRPSKELVLTTLPLTAFQVGGHILNSDAMARIDVALVHTIKGLSPMFTVLAYRIVFRVHYSIPTYLSLIPLTMGVIMACSANVSGDFVGLVFALGSALLFVTQNIVSKKLFNEAARAESDNLQPAEMRKKPDKLNLLCYSSFLAFLFTIPLWIGSEARPLLTDLFKDWSIELSSRPGALDHGRLSLEFIFNGVFHFAQSLVAFVLLSMVSPVTYSVASLIKRVFVIVFAVVWFRKPVTTIQGFGIGLTFIGLYLYDRTNDSSRVDRRVRMRQARSEQPLLPLIAEDKRTEDPTRSPSPLDGATGSGRSSPFLKDNITAVNGSAGVAGAGTSGNWLKPGTRQEDTWRVNDAVQ